MNRVKVLTRTQAVRFNDDGSVEHMTLEPGVTYGVRSCDECSSLVWITSGRWIFPKDRAYSLSE